MLSNIFILSIGEVINALFSNHTIDMQSFTMINDQYSERH